MQRQGRRATELEPAGSPRIASGGGWRRLRDGRGRGSGDAEIQPVGLYLQACAPHHIIFVHWQMEAARAAA